ncbi:alpha/beta hydrolase [Agromyces aurantiacus]|uniref:Alpha/beta hydrolase n=1 Tax=Agromyces aurantiacus TaxID=165814 RepID=A0ABV9R935_9MICO|nr:dienelactone hydrolase family protein [Agromyces aurantiacus]MBM7503327.1 phospholipase/carboxylesterase [Agromyces aurantiacus]
MTLVDLRSTDFRATDATPPAAVALLLHGFGSNERDLAGLMPMLGLPLPWASLRAPLPAGPGAAWFQITTPGSPDAAPVEAATASIWAWIDEHLDAATRVIPIGFSQGGLMATQLLRTRPERVLAPVVLGGFVLGEPQPADAELATSRPPVFWGRGAEDRVIAPHAIARTSEWLPAHSTLVERVYPGLAHGISADELADVRAFLQTHLPPVE